VKKLLGQQIDTTQQLNQLLQEFRKARQELEEDEKCINERKEQIKTEESRITNLEKDVQQRLLEIDNITNKMQSSIGGNGNKQVKLNIGGKVFMTSLATLTTEKDTFFSAMFSERFNTQPDDDGFFFIDRDYKFFSLILNHMRGVDISEPLRDLSKKDRAMLLQEVEFYQISSFPKPVNDKRYAQVWESKFNMN